MPLSSNHMNPASPALSPGEFYSSNDVSKATGVSLRQLQWWDEQGVVSPVQRGHRRMYQLHEVIEVALITELRSKSISLQKIRKILGFLKNELGGQFLHAIQGGGESHLLVDGDDIYLENNHKTIVDILKSSKQSLIGVCVSDQVERLTARVDVRKGVGREDGGVGVRDRRTGS